MYSTTTTATDTNMMASATSGYTDLDANTNIKSKLEVIDQQQQQHDGPENGSSMKRMIKASSQPHQPHDRNIRSFTTTTSAADATVTTTNPTNSQQSHDGLQNVRRYDISLRLATLSDIPSISSCNIQTLPENYNDMFYMNHINEYPYLSLVAVIDEPNTSSDDEKEEEEKARLIRQRRIHGNYEPNHATTTNSQQLGFIQRHLQMSKRRFATTFWTPQQHYGGYNNSNNNSVGAVERDHPATTTTTTGKSIVVGYLLGKITAPQEPYQFISSHSGSDRNHNFGAPFNQYNMNNGSHHHHQQQQQYRQYRSGQSYEMTGHVSSLAVLPEARRRGLARALLEQFHHHLSMTTMIGSSSLNQINHPSQNNEIVVTSTGLHVRCSNLVAVKLYETLGYKPAVTIPSYYEDGESAYYMQKVFRQPQKSQIAPERDHKKQRFGDTVLEDNNENAHSSDDYQLPRVISVLHLAENSDVEPENEVNCTGKDNSERSGSMNSSDEHVVMHEEEEEDEQMLMNGSV
jgi:ribosomal protein S18 acetylase RimI-like enzyme